MISNMRSSKVFNNVFYHWKKYPYICIRRIRHGIHGVIWEIYIRKRRNRFVVRECGGNVCYVGFLPLEVKSLTINERRRIKCAIKKYNVEEPEKAEQITLFKGEI